MSRYVKNEKGYEKSFETDWTALKKGLKKARASAGTKKKIPTSIALDPDFVADLKNVAQERGIPYQIFMRMILMDGFQKIKKKTA